MNLRGATKTIKNLWREIALNDAAQLKKSDEKLLKIHRKEAENDYLITFVNELKDQVDVSPTTECCYFKYADQICLRPNMLAILVTKGTKYACNIKSKTDHLCLQSLSIGTTYACNVENHLGVT